MPVTTGTPVVTGAFAVAGALVAGWPGFDLQGEWRILVVTNMDDDETGHQALSYDPAAAERVRQVLSGRSDVVEKKMVGGLPQAT
jgi:hypothetical protein